jgi:hypothetical protein
MKLARLITHLARTLKTRDVALTSGIPYHRLPVGTALEKWRAMKTGCTCGLEIRDTARWKTVLLSSVALCVAAFVLTGCGRKHDETGHDHGAEAEANDHGHGHGEESPSGASFKPDRGVILTEETQQSLGVTTTEVIERMLPRQIRFKAQVFGEDHNPTAAETYHADCTAKAAGLVAQDKSALINPGAPVQFARSSGERLSGVVLGVSKALAIGDAEIVVGITNAGAQLKPGEFLSANIAISRDRPVTVVPVSAVLRSAEGAFVYTLNGDAFFRTSVKTGAEAEGSIEITDGLFTGDVVVTKPVEKLWLIELRATKGGGHSH